ncbi:MULTISPECIES: serine hydrolase [unclassified Frigoribacterium]|uniref:serine hydrolase domain-containing protein n=1 Tax=unclassified Frigoribacterium TaxID=2627005 RepID=UPI000A636149|nr:MULTISPECIES: serine hydrolase domain-containing protein [unclassified Frigoribacterium]
MTPSTATPALTAQQVADLRSALPYVDGWLAYRRWRERVPGVQTAVWFDGGLQLSSAHGLADEEARVPLTTEHLFRIASHSKTFTATAVLQLVERGALRLDDPVGTFVPRLAEAGSPLADATVRELLEHGAGVIRDGLDGDYWQHGRPFPDEDELLDMLLDHGDKAPAGSAFNYSNLGYSLLGLVVAAASGRSYGEFVTESIVDRLGLTHTGPEWDDARADEYAAGHSGRHVSQTRVRLDHVDTRAMAAATGFYGTASDLVRYASAHFDGDERLLSEHSKRLAQREAWQSDASQPASAHYGLGFVIDRVGGHRVVGHSGGYPGHITRTLFDPSIGLAVSVLTNAVDGPATSLSSGVLRLLDLAREAAPAGLATRASSSDVDPARFTGRFAGEFGIVDVALLGENLVALHPGASDPVDGLDRLRVTGPREVLIAQGNGFGSVGETMRYEFDGDGRVTLLRGSGGMSMRPVTELDG